MEVKGWIIVFALLLVGIGSSFAQPKAGFTVSGIPGGGTDSANPNFPITICIRTTLILQSTASEGGGATIISSKFTYNNGSPSALPEQQYNYPTQSVTFARPGPDTIWQVVTDQLNVTDTIYQPFVVVDTHPDSIFTYDPAAPEVVCGSSNYTFTARNINNDPTLSYLWTFQASSYTNITGNPAVTQFNNAIGIGRGKYDATLLVTDQYGCTSTSTQKVLVSQIPDAAVSSPTSPVSVFNGQNIFSVCSPVSDTVFQFLNASSTYPNNKSYTVSWGDNSADSSYTDTTWSQGGAHDTLSYLYKRGYDTLSVTVTGYNGCSATQSYGVFIGSNAGGTIGNPGSTTYLCTGDSVGYSVTGYSNNAGGTIYIIKINENPVFTDTLRQADLPKTEPYIYWHTFNKASCGINDGVNPTNQYTLSYSISNPCQPPTTGDVNSVYVSGKPSPSMSVSPSLNMCNTSTATLINTTNWGEIYLTGSVVCKYIPGEQVWQVTRLSGLGGFTVNGNPGSLTPTWQGGDDSIKLNFIGTGVYQIALHVRLTTKEAPDAPPCALGDTTVFDTICVRNPPVALFTFDKKPSCAPDTLVASQLPDVNIGCAGDSVVWAVNTITLGNCGPIASGRSGNTSIDTGASSQQAKITFRQPGAYEIVLNVYAKGGGGCVGTYTDTVTINGPPVISNWKQQYAAICAGDSIQPSASVDSCYTPGPLSYQWVFTGGNIHSSSGLTAPYVTYSNPSPSGGDTISFSANNGCGTVSNTALVTVAPVPVLTPLQGETICSGDSVNHLLSSPDSSVIYNWIGKLVSGNATGITPQSNSQVIKDVLTATTTSIIEYDITGIYANGVCPSDTLKIRDTVLPTIMAYAGPDQFLCQGTNSTQLQAVQPVTGTGSWSQVGGPAAIIVDKSNPATEVTNLQSNYVYTFEWTLSNTGSRCVDSTSTMRIVLDTIVNAIDQPLPFCANDSVTVMGHRPSGADSLNYTYQWLQSNDGINYTPVSSASAVSTLKDITVPAPAANYYARIVYYHSCSDTSNAVTIRIKTTVPVPSFTPADSSGCSPLYLLFTNTTTPAPQSQFTYQWAVDNTVVSTAADSVSHTFNGPTGGYGDTAYHVILRATNGCVTVADTSLIIARGTPIASFTPDNASGCSPLTVTFANNSTGSNITSTWNFGNGTTDTVINGQAVVYTFHVKYHTNFNVTLHVNNGCSTTSDSTVISVNPSGINLNLGSNAPLNFDCTGDTVVFNNNTTGANLFNWNFGDMNSSSNTLTTTNGTGTVYHVYNSPGNDTVTLCASNGCTNDTCTSIVINVKQTPKASFTASPDTVCTDNLVTTANLTQPQDSTLAYRWTFGDGSGVYTDKEPTHKYTLAGTDTIWLVASSVFEQGFACSDSTFQLVNINGPTGQLTYGDTACTGNALTFQVTSGNTSTYTFDFGDNSPVITTTNPVVTYTYAHPGIYLPRVTLTTGDCSKLVTGVDSIRVDSVQAAFIYDSTSVCDSTIIVFKDSSYAYLGMQNVQWVINGVNYTGNTVTQAFNQTNIYPVNIKITGASGCTSAAQGQVSVYVHQTPAGNIAVNSDTCARDSVYFYANVFSNDPVQFTWDFGNGSKQAGQNAATVFNPPGTYTVQLYTLSGFGCNDTLARPVTIKTTPVIKITPLDSIWLCSGNTIQLTANGDSVTVWNWAPVNGLSCVNCATTLASPAVTTLYTATGTTSSGCSGNDSVLVNLVQPFKIAATPASTSICLPDPSQQIQFFASGAYQYIWSPSTWLSDSTAFNPVVTVPPGGIQTGDQIIYHVTGYDQYHCFTDTASVVLTLGLTPVIDLGQGTNGVAGRTVTLRPLIETNGPFNTFSWSVLSGSGTVTCLDSICDSVQLTINSDVTFKVTVENIFGCTTTDTIHYSAVCSSDDKQVYIPTAFSPDGDGINDVFMVEGEGIVVESFKVFNRWGQVVFDGGSNFAPGMPAYGWNGNVKGKPAAEDVYAYIAKVKCTAADISYFKKGNVTLMRVKK